MALNKIDLLPLDFPREQVLKAYEATGRQCLLVSAAAGLGLDGLERRHLGGVQISRDQTSNRSKSVGANLVFALSGRLSAMTSVRNHI